MSYYACRVPNKIQSISRYVAYYKTAIVPTYYLLPLGSISLHMMYIYLHENT